MFEIFNRKRRISVVLLKENLSKTYSKKIIELTAGVVLVILEGLELGVVLGLLLLVPAGKVVESDGALVGVDNESVSTLHGLEVLADAVDIFFGRVRFKYAK